VVASLRDVEEGILRCIEQGEAEECKKLVDEFVKRGGDLLALISRATQLMRDLGKKFEEGEIFLPDVMMAAEAFSVLTEALGGLQSSRRDSCEDLELCGFHRARRGNSKERQAEDMGNLWSGRKK
jgi:methanogenic corrinoid protein MtbC1